jgi:redox-sensitive bicupin YhaK (pirin superfamily)
MLKQREKVRRESTPAARGITFRTTGSGRGPIARLMSPSDLGQQLKPFVFLDLFESDASLLTSMPLHPHSGIATVTVLTDGELRFDDPGSGRGTIDYGGVEWMRAGNGVWHGREMSPGNSRTFQGFQLWVALPPELENGPSESQFIEARDMPVIGPARLIVGRYQGIQSPVRAPSGFNYLLLTLAEGETFVYHPPAGHDVGWASVARGTLEAGETISAGELVIFERGDAAITLRGGAGGATFVLGSAVPHPHDLALGNYSVHTSAEALRAGEARIAALRPR